MLRAVTGDHWPCLLAAAAAHLKAAISMTNVLGYSSAPTSGAAISCQHPSPVFSTQSATLLPFGLFSESHCDGAGFGAVGCRRPPRPGKADDGKSGRESICSASASARWAASMAAKDRIGHTVGRRILMSIPADVLGLHGATADLALRMPKRVIVANSEHFQTPVRPLQSFLNVASTVTPRVLRSRVSEHDDASPILPICRPSTGK